MVILLENLLAINEPANDARTATRNIFKDEDWLKEARLKMLKP